MFDVQEKTRTTEDKMKKFVFVAVVLLVLVFCATEVAAVLHFV